MPAPRRPNTAAATATVRRTALERRAAELRAAGYVVLSPGDADALRAHVAELADKQPWENRVMFERVASMGDDLSRPCPYDPNHNVLTCQRCEWRNLHGYPARSRT